MVTSMMSWHNCMLRELELVGINYLGIVDDIPHVVAGIFCSIFQ